MRGTALVCLVALAGCRQADDGAATQDQQAVGQPKAVPQLNRIALPELDANFRAIDAATISIYASDGSIGIARTPTASPAALDIDDSAAGLLRPLFEELLSLLSSSALTQDAAGDGARMVLASTPVALYADASLPASRVAAIAWTARAAGVEGELLLVAQVGGRRTGIAIRGPKPTIDGSLNPPPEFVLRIQAKGAVLESNGEGAELASPAQAKQALEEAFASGNMPALGLVLPAQATQRDLMAWASMAREVGAAQVILAVDGSFSPPIPASAAEEVERAVGRANAALCDEQIPTLLEVHKADPKNESVYDAIARAYGGICNDAAAESEWIRKRTEVFPASADAWHALAMRRFRALIPPAGESVAASVPEASRASRADEVIGHLELALAADVDHRPSLALMVIARHQRKLARVFPEPPRTIEDKQEAARALLDGHLSWAATKRLCDLDQIPDCAADEEANGQCCPAAPFPKSAVERARAQLR